MPTDRHILTPDEISQITPYPPHPHTRSMIYGIYTRGFHIKPDDGR